MKTKMYYQHRLSVIKIYAFSWYHVSLVALDLEKTLTLNYRS